MQANAEAQATQEAEAEGLVLIRKLREAEDLIAALSKAVSWGYVRAGNAYAKSAPPKPRVPAIDIPPVAAQLGD